MYISWHLPDYTFFISIIPVVEQVCLFLSDIFPLRLLTALPCLLPNQMINFLLFFVSGSLMKISSKIGPSATPQKVHLKCASRQEGLPIVWSIPICLLRGSFGPDSFLAIPSHSLLVKILHVAHYKKCFTQAQRDESQSTACLQNMISVIRIKTNWISLAWSKLGKFKFRFIPWSF